MTSDLRDVLTASARQAGLLAIDVHVDRRIVQRLRRTASRAGPECRRARSAASRHTARFSAKLGPLTDTSIGVGEPKLITSLTMSAGSNEKRTLGHARWATSPRSSSPSACSMSMPLPCFSATHKNRLFRAARPLIHGIDRKGRRDRAHVAQRQGDVLRADFLLDRAEHACVAICSRAVDVRAVGRAQPQAKLAGVDRAEKFPCPADVPSQRRSTRH